MIKDNLLKNIIDDFFNNKLVSILISIVIFSAIAVVYSSYLNRGLSNSWDKLVQEQDILDIEWRNLLLEEQALAEHSRVSKIATEELSMQRPLPRDEIVVKVP